MAQKSAKKKSIIEKINLNHFRVAIFGSARTKKTHKTYKQVYNLAKKLAELEIDIITGGGKGIMEAANQGHSAGDINNKSQSIGLTIKLPFEAKPNEFVELRKHFEKFSDRLDTFMAISNAVVVMPGGIGTCLELFYTWQLTQVKHIYQMPIIVVGNQWIKLLEWVKKYLLKNDLITKSDLNNIYIAKNNEQAINLIQAHFKNYKKLKNGKILGNIKKYKLD